MHSPLTICLKAPHSSIKPLSSHPPKNLPTRRTWCSHSLEERKYVVCAGGDAQLTCSSPPVNTSNPNPRTAASGLY